RLHEGRLYAILWRRALAGTKMRPAPPVVLLTGCSSGIGRASVPLLRAAGCRVAATARRVEDVAGLAEPGWVEALALDVTDAASRAAAVQATAQAYGRIDVLVNNAGYGVNLAVEDTDLGTMRRLFETNLFGAHEMARLVLPGMRERGRGRIVNVAS